MHASSFYLAQTIRKLVQYRSLALTLELDASLILNARVYSVVWWVVHSRIYLLAEGIHECS
jgi:hypothetical protein